MRSDCRLPARVRRQRTSRLRLLAAATAVRLLLAAAAAVRLCGATRGTVSRVCCAARTRCSRPPTLACTGLQRLAAQRGQPVRVGRHHLRAGRNALRGAWAQPAWARTLSCSCSYSAARRLCRAASSPCASRSASTTRTSRRACGSRARCSTPTACARCALCALRVRPSLRACCVRCLRPADWTRSLRSVFRWHALYGHHPGPVVAHPQRVHAADLYPGAARPCVRAATCACKRVRVRTAPACASACAAVAVA